MGEGLSSGSQAKTVGDRNTRHPVFESAGASDAVDQVPGGISVTVLDQSDDWVRIRLPGNREVWISKANLVAG